MVFIGNLPAGRLAAARASLGALDGVEEMDDNSFVVVWPARECEACCTPCGYLPYKFAPRRVKWTRRSAMAATVLSVLTMAAYGWGNRAQWQGAACAVIGALGILFCYNKRGYFWAPAWLIASAILQYDIIAQWLQPSDGVGDSQEDAFDGEGPLRRSKFLAIIATASIVFLVLAAACACFTRCTWDEMKVTRTEAEMRKILVKKAVRDPAPQQAPEEGPRRDVGDFDLELAQPRAAPIARKGFMWQPRRIHRPPVCNSPPLESGTDSEVGSLRNDSASKGPVQAPSSTTPAVSTMTEGGNKPALNGSDAFQRAARAGNLRLLKSLAIASGQDWRAKLGRRSMLLMSARAAEGGHREVLRWARREGCPWNELTCKAAAEGGHMEVLEWARANGCPWDEETCCMAARGGHLKLLQWARAKGCSWDERTTSSAARGGHLDVLKWARAAGCPWDISVCRAAVEGEHVAVLAWLGETRCEYTMTEVFRRWLMESDTESDFASSWLSVQG